MPEFGVRKFNYGTAVIDGIDVSHLQGTIDWAAVAKAGVKFAYIKVGQGSTFTDPSAKHNAEQAKKHGIVVGAYWFVDPAWSRNGRIEAARFMALARDAGLLKKGCLAPVADIETTKLPHGFSSRRYMFDFVEHVIAVIKRRPVIYTGKWFWDGVLGARNRHGCPLWLAAYTPRWAKFIPSGWKRVTFHQYSGHGKVPGIKTYVDLDVFLGTLNELKAHHTLKHDI